MLALGCDHGGYPLMKEVIKYLEDNKIAFKNFGTYSEASVDYPEYAKRLHTQLPKANVKRVS